MNELSSVEYGLKQSHKHQAIFLVLNGLTAAWIVGSLGSALIGPAFAIAALQGICAFRFTKRGSTIGIRAGQVAYLMSSTILGLMGIVWLMNGIMLDAILVMILAGLGIIRVQRMEHPDYKQWYSGGAAALAHLRYTTENEVLASCPSCGSLLGIVLEKLLASDTCPHCSDPLVPSAHNESE
ncbi:MAG: hypothetical protein QGH13_01125 [Candidatus Thalassarchaeaceae archaeon]|jgi:hypothetical protein|nr:hypothetical protein [Candidatus Thalassarchaeaceae archaeon]